MAIYLPILAFFVILVGLILATLFFKYHLNKPKLAPMDPPPLTFGQEQYEKYMMKNTADQKISNKVEKAFSKMELVQFKVEDGERSMMADLGKCTSCL
mmetsp:Transcript_26823/g.25875  ORF Transcript_26823/g.25875 Transcript_26823/m.25875 type:complete len:98 (-) Transcript_26823:232-525(-)